MRTAVICLAYLRNTSGVDLLAEYFEGTDTDLFIHVDAKVDASVYEKSEAGREHVHILPNRFPIYWGGFNTVRSAVSSIEYARQIASYGRFLFLTEDTIPVISKSEFQRRMASKVEYFETRLTTSPNIVKRYTEFFYLDSLATTPRPGVIISRFVSDEMLVAINRLSALRARGKAVVKDLYHGGTWWGLTSGSIDKILNAYHEDYHLRESFEFSAIPEEQYFHTILGPLENAQPLLFTDWSRQPTPYIFRSADELKEVDTLGRCFLRKIAVDQQSIRDFVLDLG